MPVKDANCFRTLVINVMLAAAVLSYVFDGMDSFPMTGLSTLPGAALNLRAGAD